MNYEGRLYYFFSWIFKDGKSKLYKRKHCEKILTIYKRTNSKGNEQPSRIRKRFIKLEDRELKAREVKIKRWIEEEFFKPTSLK